MIAFEFGEKFVSDLQKKVDDPKEVRLVYPPILENARCCKQAGSEAGGNCQQGTTLLCGPPCLCFGGKKYRNKGSRERPSQRYL